MEQWDIFLSYARQDAIRARPLAAALRDRGLTVFVDETDVRDFRSITRLIGTALGNSRVVLSLYSAIYQQRLACQLELTLAYLAGQQEGDPRRRVVVVNPEATMEHIHPIELRDSRHFPATGGALAELAELLVAHLKDVNTPIGSVLPLTSPRWLPQPRSRVPSPASAGNRLPDLWRLHSALHPHSAALVTGRIHPGIAILRGVAPAELAHSYAVKFGSAYSGGVFWFAADRYQEQVATVRSALDPAIRGNGLTADLNRLAILLEQPILWVVDGVPDEFGAPEALLAPSPLGATILITESTEYDLLGGSLTLPEPGDSMFGMSELPTTTERERLAAFDLQVELVTRVGVQQLGSGTGSLREALTSLRSIFDTTRAVFHGYGPTASAVRRPAEDLLTVLRPFLESWHPRLSAHEYRRPAEISAFEHEQAWSDAPLMRQEMANLSMPLRGVVSELGRISGSDLGVSD